MHTPALSFIEDALSALEQAVHDRDAALRNVQVATVSPDGAPGLRTLVLRAFGRAPAVAEMHTDARAGKARDIAHARRVSVLAWSSADRLQLRFAGSARLHRDDDVARARWDTLSPNARDTYGLRAEPGVPIADPADRSHLPAEEQFRQFMVILVSLGDVDVLRLGPGGEQRRAFGRFTPSGLAASWIGA
jgi:pyridoxamine 5'-phosphate oxidase